MIYMILISLVSFIYSVDHLSVTFGLYLFIHSFIYLFIYLYFLFLFPATVDALRTSLRGCN